MVLVSQILKQVSDTCVVTGLVVVSGGLFLCLLHWIFVPARLDRFNNGYSSLIYIFSIAF